MEMRLLTGADAIGRQRWHDFVKNHPQGSIFQMPDMHDLYEAVPTFTPIIQALEDEQGKLKVIILAVLIRDYKGLMRLLLSRTIVYGGPLIDPEEKQPAFWMNAILKTLIQSVCKQSRYIEFRNIYDQKQHTSVFGQNQFIYQDHLNLIVNTEDAESTLSQISRSKIRQVRRSNRAGAELVIASTREEVQELYQILRKIYSERIRKPLPPEAFFTSFLEFSKQGRLGTILLVKYRGKVAGGMVCPITPGKSLNEWYICGLDKKFTEVYPSVMLTFGAIEYAINHNLPSFDFMGIGTPNRPYGVRDFKTRFGGQIVDYGRFIRFNSRIMYPFARIATRSFEQIVRITAKTKKKRYTE